MEFLIRFAQFHPTFRKPEIEAIADLHGVTLEILEYTNDLPFCIARLPSESAAKKLVSRCILVESICELWGFGASYDLLHEDVKRRTEHKWQKYKTCSFRFQIQGHRYHRTTSAGRAIINSFAYLAFEGPIAMNGADEVFMVHELWPQTPPSSKTGEELEEYKRTAIPERIFFGRFVGNGGRDAVHRFSLKSRSYINTTSMDAELSLITANLAQAAPGRIVMDPFAGTGGFCVSAAYFGAVTIGADIDGRVLRGKSKEKTLLSNFEQYGLTSGWIDGVTSDLTNTPFRKGVGNRWIDGIVCDPPYGIREACKVLGSTRPLKEVAIVDGVLAHTLPGFIAPKKQYSFDAMMQDLLFFAAEILVDNGRLSVWMPTANEDNVDLTIPQSPYLELKSVSVQDFGKWARRLLTYARIPESITGTILVPNSTTVSGKTADELNKFRKRYFESFKTETSESEASEPAA